jgi:hypothetical protein
MQIADSVERNGLDLQIVATEAKTGEPVGRRLAKAVSRFEGRPAAVRSAAGDPSS